MKKTIKQWMKEQNPRQVQEMIDKHYILLSSIVNRYKSKNFSREELMAEASLGLIRAATSFDEKANVKFSTYAYFWIKNRILSFINSHNNVKSAQYNKHTRIVYDIEHLVNINLENSNNNSSSIDNYKDEFDYIAAFNVFISTLHENERQILLSRIRGKVTLVELGKQLGCSRETVRQIEIKQINNFKMFLKNVMKFEEIYGFITCTMLLFFLF